MTPRVRNVLVLGIVAVAALIFVSFRAEVRGTSAWNPFELKNGKDPSSSRPAARPLDDMKKGTVTLGDVSYAVEIADTRALQELGLGNRDALAPGSGMLFVFTEPAEYGFWMKDMRFPIDIVWLGDDGKVLGAAENVDYKNQEKTYYPPAPVRYALELAAGEYAKAGKPDGWKVIRK